MGKVDIVEHGLYFDMIQFPKLKSPCDIAISVQREAMLNQNLTPLAGYCTYF